MNNLKIYGAETTCLSGHFKCAATVNSLLITTLYHSVTSVKGLIYLIHKSVSPLF